jgi:hypothetical protein
METTAPPTLRPLRLGELLDRAIRLYRANFLTFIGIIAVVYVPLTVLQIAASTLATNSLGSLSGTSNPEEIFTNYSYWIGVLSTIVLSLVQFVLVQGVATGALTRSVADSYLGKKTGILDAYRGIGKSWLSLLGALLLIILILILLSVWWIIVPCIGWLTGLGMLMFVSSVVNPLVPPVVVLENRGAIDSIRRAWNLARRRFWPVLGYIIVLMLFSWLVINGPVTIMNLVLSGVFQSFEDLTMQFVLMSIIQGLVSLVFVLLYYPLQMTAFTLIYFDLRVRTEGYDLALLTAQAAHTESADNTAVIPTSETNERLITGPELGNFAILTLAGVGLYIFFVSFIMGGVFFLSALFG